MNTYPQHGIGWSKWLLVALAWLLLSVPVFCAITLTITPTPALPPNVPPGTPIPANVQISCTDDNVPPTCAQPIQVAFVWSDASGGAVFQASPPATLPPAGGPAFDIFTCAGSCPASPPPNNLKLTVTAIDAGPPVNLVQLTSVPFMPPPAAPQLSAAPSPPQSTDLITASASQPASTPPIVSHEYVWTAQGQPPTTNTVKAGDGLNSKDAFQCDATLCPPASVVQVQATAIDSQGVRSKPTLLSIVIASKPPALPTLTAFSPDADGKSLPALQSTGGLVVDPTSSFSFTFAPSDGDTQDYAYHYHLLVNGQDSAFQPLDNSNGQAALDCSSLGCKAGDVLTLSVQGVRGGQQSAAKSYSLQMRSAGTALPALTGLCAQQSVWQWIGYMGIGLLILSLVIALVYMLGESLNLPHFLDWSKTEALQMGMAIVLFVVIAFLVNLECSLHMGQFIHWTGLSGYLVGDDMTMMQAGQEYLAWSAEQTHMTIVLIRRDMGALNIRATYNQYDNQAFGLGGNGYSSTPYAGDWTSVGSLGMLLNLNSTFLLSALFEFFSLAFFAAGQGLFLFLVPIGLVLRSLPFLRQFGGSLVAIAVGFYIFYPLTMAMLGLVVPPLYFGHDATDVGASFGAGTIQAAQLSEQELTGSSIFSYFNTYPDVWMEKSGQPDLGIYFKLTALNFVRSVFLPSVALIITVMFVRDLSSLFGEEVDASRLVQLV